VSPPRDDERPEVAGSPVEGLDREVSEALLRAHRNLDLADVIAALLEPVRAWTGAEAAFAYVPGDRAGVSVPSVATVNEDDPRRTWLRELERARIDEVVGVAAERVFEGLGPLASDTGKAAAARSIAAFPVRGGAPEAVSLIVALEPGERDRARVHALLRGARPAVANALRVAAMRELIIKDDTAGCYNRRHFEESLPEELSRSQRFRSPMSLIFLDLDNLKQVNSRHGHSMGSRTLYEVSLRVRAKIRKFDKLFRFGGDEFCILLPETEWHGALEVAERVREAIAGSNFLTGLVADPGGVRVTASFGIASYPLHARTKEDIIVQADRAMQRIKNGTKNSIAIAEIVGETHES